MTAGRSRYSTRILRRSSRQDTSSAGALSGNDAVLLVDSTIEEAAPRQARFDAAVAPSNETAGFRAKFDRLKYEQQAFLDAAEDNLSTFAIDVDTGSYTIMRPGDHWGGCSDNGLINPLFQQQRRQTIGVFAFDRNT